MFATKSSGFCVAQSKIFQLMSTDDLQTHELIEAHTFTNMYCLRRWFKVFFAFFMRFNADIVFKRDLLVAFQRCIFRIHMKDSHMNHLINRILTWDLMAKLLAICNWMIFSNLYHGKKWLAWKITICHPFEKTWFFAFSGSFPWIPTVGTFWRPWRRATSSPRPNENRRRVTRPQLPAKDATRDTGVKQKLRFFRKRHPGSTQTSWGRLVVENYHYLQGFFWHF